MHFQNQAGMPGFTPSKEQYNANNSQQREPLTYFPVSLQMLNDVSQGAGENIMIDNKKMIMAQVVGRVINIENSQNRSTLTVTDNTQHIQVVYFNKEESQNEYFQNFLSNYQPNTYAKILLQVRKQSNNNVSYIIQNIHVISNFNELTKFNIEILLRSKQRQEGFKKQEKKLLQKDQNYVKQQILKYLNEKGKDQQHFTIFKSEIDSNFQNENQNYYKNVIDEFMRLGAISEIHGEYMVYLDIITN